MGHKGEKKNDKPTVEYRLGEVIGVVFTKKNHHRQTQAGRGKDIVGVLEGAGNFSFLEPRAK